MYAYPTMGKVEVETPTNVVYNYMDILQAKMNKLLRVFELFQAYINDLLIITKDDWYDH